MVQGRSKDLFNQTLLDKLNGLPSRDSEIVITTAEGGWPEPVMARDGVMRIPLSAHDAYFLDPDSSGKIVTSVPFWILPYSGSESFATVTIRSASTATLEYTGTEIMFYGENTPAFSFERVLFRSTEGCPAFNLVQNPFMIAASFMRILDLEGFGDLGYISGYNAMDWSPTIFVKWGGSLKVHNMQSLNIRNFTVIQPAFLGAVSSNQPLFIFTSPRATTLVINVSDLLLENGESLIGVSTDIVINQQLNISNNGFTKANGATFFQPQFGGSITLIQDLSTLITGAVTAYEHDGFGSVLVTHVGHNAYVGLNVNHTDTTNYNGTHNVLRKVSVDQYVMSASYAGDESSGNYTAIGVRMTSTAHGMTNFRETVISASVNYDGAIQALNTAPNTFDITTAFVINETATFTTDSLQLHDPRLLLNNNGEQQDSGKVAAMSLSAPQEVTINTLGIYERIDSTNWVDDGNQQWLKVGSIQRFIGINPTAMVITYHGTVEKQGGGSDQIGVKIRKRTLPSATFDEIDGSISAPEDNTPMNVGGHAIATFNTGDEYDTATTNLSTTANVNVENMSTIATKVP